MKYLINKFNNKNIYLLDAIGALISACLLLFIITFFSTQFSIPTSFVHGLIIMSFMMSIHSFLAYTFSKKYWRSYLKYIALINVNYSIVTFACCISLNYDLTLMVPIYFALEATVLILLSYVEIKISFGNEEKENQL